MNFAVYVGSGYEYILPTIARTDNIDVDWLRKNIHFLILDYDEMLEKGKVILYGKEPLKHYVYYEYWVKFEEKWKYKYDEHLSILRSQKLHSL